MDKSRAPTSATSSSYAPRSPDLSALHTSYIPDPQTIPPNQSIYATNSDQYQHNREGFSLPQPTHASPGYLAPPLPQDDSFGSQVYGAPPPQSIYMQQHEMQQNPYMSMSPHAQNPVTGPSSASSRPRRQVKQDPGEAEWLPQPNQFSHFDQFQNIPPQSLQPLKSEHSQMKQEESEPQKPAPGELEGTVVKTKFPVARIKRIVQADEDVGKVAQVTPVVVSKALELFMISVALKSADEARRRQSKRVTGQHLKAIVQGDVQFDFLSDIIGKIPDAPTSKDSGKKVGAKNEESEEDDALDEECEQPASTAKRKGKAAAGSSGVGTRTRRKKESPS